MYDGESAQEKISENSPPKNKNLNKTSFDVFLVLFWYVLVFIEAYRLHLKYNYILYNENKVTLTRNFGIVAFGGIFEYFLIKRNRVLVNVFEICD